MQEGNTSRRTRKPNHRREAAGGGWVLNSPNRGWVRAREEDGEDGRCPARCGLGRLPWMCGKGGMAVLRLWAVVGEQGLHCRLQNLKLVLGLHNLHDLQDPGLTFYIREAIKHPGYNHKYENDLALLKVRARWGGVAEGLP